MADGVAPSPVSRRRPVLVWIVSIFCLFAACFSLLSLARSRAVAFDPDSMTEVQRQFFASQNALSYAIAAGIHLANLIAAFYLFFLRKPALYLFAISFAVWLLHTAFNAAINNWLSVVGVSGLALAIVGGLVDIAIILYVRRLDRSGFLR